MQQQSTATTFTFAVAEIDVEKKAGEIWPNIDHSADELQLECQTKKAFIDGGQERVDEIAGPAFGRAVRNVPAEQRGEAAEVRLTLSEAFADAGYTCERTPWVRPPRR